MPTDIAIIGAAGRMGSRIAALAEEHGCRVVASIFRDGQSGDVAELTPTPQVVIDFSSPSGTRKWVDVCRRRGIPMVIGVTGLAAAEIAAIEQAAREIPVLYAPNMSVGVLILSRLARDAAALLGDGCDIEIVEAHHRSKRDAPSGTALVLAEVIGRPGTPIHALRIGDEVGRHTVYLATAGERLELSHVATSRDTFARGALRAATWVVRQPPGRYGMADVLGLEPR